MVPRAAIPALPDGGGGHRRRSTARSSPDAATSATATCTCRSSSPTRASRTRLLRAVFRAGIDLGGAVSGEHGIGTEKKQYFLELEDPVKLALMRRIKEAFDPHGILGPGNLLD